MRLPGVPVVVWALHETGLVEGGFDHGSITTQGATVGAPMLSNLLSRADRPFELVLGRRSDPDGLRRVREALRLAGVARGIARSRLGRIGRPLDGYAHVDVDDAALRDGDRDRPSWRSIRTRSSRPIEPSPTADVDALEADVRRDWTVADDVVEGESLERSLRAALALEAVVDAHGLDGGAFNCHVPQFRFGEPIGIAPCWALGRLTSGGRPFTCTGDIVTAVAMLTTKRLGGAAVYHEIEAIDYATRRGRHRELRRARPGVAGPRRAAEAAAQRLVLRQGSALRGVRRVRARGRAGHAGRVHAASHARAAASATSWRAAS